MATELKSILKVSTSIAAAKKQVTFAQLPTPLTSAEKMASFLLRSLQKTDTSLKSRAVKRKAEDSPSSQERPAKSLKRFKSFRSQQDFKLEATCGDDDYSFEDIFSGCLSPEKQ